MKEAGGGREFKAALAALRRRRRFVPYGESSGFAEDLRDLLSGLPDDLDPKTGLRLIAGFYRADAAVLGNCDDSNGSIGDVFRMDARARFARYAERCTDKKFVADVVYDLLEDDGFGVRDSVLGGAFDYLGEAPLRRLADREWEAASVLAHQGGKDRDWSRHTRLLLVELIAGELNDPALFERARSANHPELGPAACAEIANAWLKAGEPEVALRWLDRIPADQAFMREDRDLVRAEIYRQQGRPAELEAVLRRRFHDAPSQATLDPLLEAIGAEHRNDVVREAAEKIARSSDFDPAGAAFLLYCADSAAAAANVIERRAQVNGDHWYTLLPMARALSDAGQPLASTVLYRALLDSILSRAQTRTYGHGVRHWRTLDRLARDVTGWGAVAPHADYVAALRASHHRKSSFWKRLDSARPWPVSRP